MEEKIRRFQKLTKINKNIFQLPGGKSLKSSQHIVALETVRNWVRNT